MLGFSGHGHLGPQTWTLTPICHKLASVQSLTLWAFDSSPVNRADISYLVVRMKLDSGCVTASTAAATKTGKHDHRCFRGWEPGAPLRTQEQPNPDTALFQGSLQRQPAPCTPRKAKKAIPLEKPTSQGHPQARPVTGVPLQGRRETQQTRRRKEGGKEKCGGAHKKAPIGAEPPPSPAASALGHARTRETATFWLLRNAQECVCQERGIWGLGRAETQLLL